MTRKKRILQVQMSADELREEVASHGDPEALAKVDRWVVTRKADAEDEARADRFERAIKGGFPEAKVPGDSGYEENDEENDLETRRC